MVTGEWWLSSRSTSLLTKIPRTPRSSTCRRENYMKSCFHLLTSVVPVKVISKSPWNGFFSEPASNSPKLLQWKMIGEWCGITHFMTMWWAVSLIGLDPPDWMVNLAKSSSPPLISKLQQSNIIFIVVITFQPPSKYLESRTNGSVTMSSPSWYPLENSSDDLSASIFPPAFNSDYRKSKPSTTCWEEEEGQSEGPHVLQSSSALLELWRF